MNQPTPVQLKQMGPTLLGIHWNDGHDAIYRVRHLRLACPCAVCVDEWTRVKKLDDNSVPADIQPKSIEPVGRYALRILWSDGHDTGFYTFQALRELCECHACQKRS